MKIVVDANIIFSALISGKEFYITILENIEAYAPDFLLIEIEKYEKRILEKTKSSEKMKKVLYLFFENINIIPKIGISKKSWIESYNICKDIDEKDTPYLALALEIDGYLWSNDLKLISKLKEKGFLKCITTQELIKKLNLPDI